MSWQRTMSRDLKKDLVTNYTNLSHFAFSVVHPEDDRPYRDPAGQPAVPANTVSETKRKLLN